MFADEEEHSDGSSPFHTFICHNEGRGLEHQGHCCNCFVFCHWCHCREVTPVKIRKRLATACVVNETNVTKQKELDAEYSVAMPYNLGSAGSLNYKKGKEKYSTLCTKKQ